MTRVTLNYLFTFHKHLSSCFETTRVRYDRIYNLNSYMYLWTSQVNKVEYMDTTGSSKLTQNGTSCGTRRSFGRLVIHKIKLRSRSKKRNTCTYTYLFVVVVFLATTITILFFSDVYHKGKWLKGEIKWSIITMYNPLTFLFSSTVQRDLEGDVWTLEELTWGFAKLENILVLYLVPSVALLLRINQLTPQHLN